MGVRVERQGAAAVVVLDWPEARNALGPDECKEVAAAVAGAGEDPDVAGVVVAGEGTAFCAGGNLKSTASRDGIDPEVRRTIVYTAFQSMIRALIASPVPTVAAIDGPAIGMGLDIALACDSRFFGPNAWALQGWGRVGFVPGTGGELYLRRKAPDVLWRLLEDQPKIDAAMAERLGLGESSGDRPALERALERVEKLSRLGRVALEAYADLYRTDMRAGLDEYLERSALWQSKVLTDPGTKARIAKVMESSRGSGQG